MKKQKLSKVRSTEEEVDLFNNLPDVLLVSIISLLPGTEGVRTSVLSHRWKSLWKHSSHLSFDQRQMLKALSDDYIEKSYLKMMHLSGAVRRKVFLKENFDRISRVAKLITSTIDNQIGPLKSCTIRHLSESCASGDIVIWMKKLLSKGVMKVSMELEILNYCQEIVVLFLSSATETLNLPFHIFSSFEVLELKNYNFTTTLFPDPPQVLKTLTLNNVCIESYLLQEILTHCLSLKNLTIEQCDSIGEEITIDSLNLKYFKICGMMVRKVLISAVNIEVIEFGSSISSLGEVVFETPKLQVLCVYKYKKCHGECISLFGNKLKKTIDIFQIYGGILDCRGLCMAKFINLKTLCFDLNLTSNFIALYLAMKSCHHLKNLEINIKVSMRNNDDENNSDSLPYHEDLFWEKMVPRKCINELKSICLKGYKGRKFEEGFVKYLVTKVENLKRAL